MSCANRRATTGRAAAEAVREAAAGEWRAAHREPSECVVRHEDERIEPRGDVGAKEAMDCVGDIGELTGLDVPHTSDLDDASAHTQGHAAVKAGRGQATLECRDALTA